MNKKFTFNLLSKLCMLVVLGVTSGFYANADEDLGALNLNQVYECPSFKFVRASFTPSESGSYRFNYNSSDRFAIYTDEDLTIPTGSGDDWVYKNEEVEGLRIMGYETRVLEGGMTYYLGGSEGSGLFIMNSNSQFVITKASEELLLDYTKPEAESVVSISANEQVDFSFNMSVSVESATISTGSVSEELIFSSDADSKVRVYANNVTVIFKELLSKWLGEGTIKENDVFTITLNGVKSVDGSLTYGDDGKVMVSFVSAGLPTMLVGTTNTPDKMSSLKSYYLNGDEQGLISLIFDKNLLNDPSDKPFAMLGIGDKESENGDYYEEVIDCEVNGNVLTINLQNKLRDQQTMGLSMEYIGAQLDIKNVKAEDGNYVYSEGSGKLGSFNYAYNFEYLNYEIASDFTPAGGSLTGVENIEIWIRGDKYLQYEGVTFQYIENGETQKVEILMSDISKEDDPMEVGAAILNVPVPYFMADADSQVLVYLTNVLCADGYDHTADVCGRFTAPVVGDKEIVLVATPENGSVVENIATISLLWEGARTVTVDPMMMVGGAKVYKKGSDEVFSDMICAPTGTGNTANIDAFNIATENGEYVVEIAAGMFLVDGEAWDAITLNYTISSTTIELVNKGEVPLNQLEMTVTPCEKLEFNTESTDKVTLAYLVNGITELGTYEVEITGANTANLTLNTNAELQSGNYVVWFPEGYFLIDGELSVDMKVYYDDVVFAGVENIVINASKHDVYTLGGVLVKKDATSADVKNLPSGVYIVNGHKVMITK